MMRNMKYFFVLGTNTALSIAELGAIFDLSKSKLLAPDFLLADLDVEINSETLINRLGGTIKIGIIRAEVDINNNPDLVKAVIKLAAQKKENAAEGKFNFGYSCYGQNNFNKKDLGIKVKNYFNEHEISSRFVVSQEKTLSSVVITQNKLLTRGIEIVLVNDNENKKALIGETISTQPFKDLSRRDFGRPARDDLSGMLPPKIALIMLNLAQVKSNDSVIVDPFCGSGTILSEALLLGYNNLFGSDISIKAIEDTRINTSWLKELYSLKDFHLKLLVKNVANLSKFIKSNYVEAIVTEPYLGPQRGLLNFKIINKNLEDLYSTAISEFHKVLKNGGRVVMIWPSFYGQRPITPSYRGFKIVDMIPENLAAGQYVNKNTRPTIIYGRPGQKVFREIVVLEKM